MLPAPGETAWAAAVVESERRVAGEVLCKNGHMDLDWRKRASMVVNGCYCFARQAGVVVGPYVVYCSFVGVSGRLVCTPVRECDTNQFIWSESNAKQHRRSADGLGLGGC
jgi:hypothetical protein